MSALNCILLGVIFCLAPAGVLWLCRRFPLLDKLGPIMILYGLGILIGNIGWHPAEMPIMQEIATSATIPLAIPMMLFGCHFTLSEASLQLKVCISGFLSVFLAVVLGYMLFGKHINEGAEIGGIMSGMYTGGMLNAAALQSIFKVEEQAYIIMCSYDIVISFLYLVFLVSVGYKLSRRLYGEHGERSLSESDRKELEQQIEIQKQNPYEGLWSKEGIKELGKIVGATLLLVALAAASTIPFASEWFMVIFILVLSTLGVVCSFFNLSYTFTRNPVFL